MSNVVYIGEYSPRCAEKYGSVIWLDINGSEVEVTAAYPSFTKTVSKWIDKRIVSGNLSRYLRKGRTGTSEPMRAPFEPYILTEKDFL